MLKALPGAVRNGRARYFHIYLEVLGGEAVLVRVDSVDTLRRAYPNYFADAALFLAELKNALDAAE